jgi:hypothetical protein
VFDLANRRSKVVEELLHLGVGVGQDEGEAVVGARLNSSKYVGEREALVAEAWWTLAALQPDMAGPTLLADPCLVLEEQADTLVFMHTLNLSEQRRGSFKSPPGRLDPSPDGWAAPFVA